MGSFFSSARARVKEEIESRVAPHLGGDVFHQYLSLLFARLGGTVAWVQHVDGHASRNINIRIGDNVREVQREDKGVYKRVDSLGHYVFKYTDDHGRNHAAFWDGKALTLTPPTT